MEPYPQLNPIEADAVEHVFRTSPRRTIDWRTPGLMFTRVRYLGGMTRGGWVWDLSYIHGSLNGELVNVSAPELGQIQTRSKNLQELRFHLIQLGAEHRVHMYRAGLRDALSTMS